MFTVDVKQQYNITETDMVNESSVFEPLKFYSMSIDNNNNKGFGYENYLCIDV